MPIKTPISEVMLQTVIQGGKFVDPSNQQITSGSDWMGPQQPIPVSAPENVAGRQFDYPVGYNISIRPRSYEPITFDQLRALAENWTLIRLLIETRKDLLCAMRWDIVPEDAGKEPDDRCKEVKDFFKFPDKEHSWRDWLRMLLEDLLVLDAPAIYPRKTKGGKLYSLEPLDGATITRKIDGSGRTPLPPQPAYQQILKGIPAGDFTRDELIYKPRNIRTHKIYGFSPVEQTVFYVNLALRRDLSKMQFYTDGSTPDSIITTPIDWNPDQIKQMQKFWDEILSGNTAERRKARFIPGGTAVINTKEGILKDEFDEWIARIASYAFGLPANVFIKQQNRATASTAQDQAVSEGMVPYLDWIQELIGQIIFRDFGYTDLMLKWIDTKDPDLAQEAAIDLQNAQAQQIRIQSGVLDVNEVRVERGLDPLTPEQLKERKPAPPPQLAGPTDNGAKPAPEEPVSPDATIKELVAKLEKKKPDPQLRRLTVTGPRY